MRTTHAALSAALALACACFAGASQAQSSVTLYGTLDEGINYTSRTKAGASAWQMSSGDLSTSRWGLKGDEDLGSGLRAMFNLESGFDAGTGRSAYDGRLFGYQANVGLQSDRFGTLSFGRQYDSVYDTLAPLTASGSWGGTLFSHPLDNDNTNGTYRADNAVKYRSATFGGLSATTLFGFSNQAGGFASNRIFSAGLNYSRASLTLAAAYADLAGPGSSAGGAVTGDDAGFTAQGQQTWGAGASYGIGAVTLGAVYTHVTVQDASASSWLPDMIFAFSHLKFDNAEINLKYNVTPDFLIGGMYTYTRAALEQATADASLHWDQAGLIAQYNLSKRTSVYGQLVYQRASGDSGTALDQALIPGSAGPAPGNHQITGRIAVLHTF